MARWFRCWLGLLPALSVAGALRSFTMLRFHIPLIKPDVRISRIRLSDKESRVRSREVTLQPSKSDQAEFQVQVFGRES